MSDWWHADPVTRSPAPAAGGNWWDADAAEQTAAPAAASTRTPGLGGQLLTGFENTLAAGGQLTTPNISAHAPNYLGPATITETGDVGYKDASGNFVPTDRNQHVVLTDPTDQVPKVYARTPETDEGRLSALGHIVGAGLGASTLPAAGSVALQAGQRIGVTVPRVISSQVPGVNLLGQVVMKAPGGGPLYKAVGGGP
jgi:hypothetical protein